MLSKDELIRKAADLGTSYANVSKLHTDPSYKALSDADKAEVTQTYYEAVKYQQQYDEEEYQACSTIGNLDLIA